MWDAHSVNAGYNLVREERVGVGKKKKMDGLSAGKGREDRQKQ